MARPHALAALPDEPEQPKREIAPPQTAHDVQAAVEDVPVGDRVEFMGESYRIADKIGLMPLIRFARAARAGANADDMEGLAAIGDMLQDCIHPDEWDRFEADATAKKAEGDDLVPVVQQTIEILTARPTRRPVDSSTGPSTTGASSTGSSPSPATQAGQVTEKLYTVDDLIKQAGA